MPSFKNNCRNSMDTENPKEINTDFTIHLYTLFPGFVASIDKYNQENGVNSITFSIPSVIKLPSVSYKFHLPITSLNGYMYNSLQNKVRNRIIAT